MFFSYDHENGIEFHETAEAAKARAEENFQYDQDAAPDGWHEEVDSICWGKVSERVVETDRHPDPSGEFEELISYELKPITNNQ